MYHGQLVHADGPKAWYYKHESQDKILSLASQQMRKLRGTLRQEVFGHPGSFIFTDGTEIVGMLTIGKEEE